MFSHDSGLVPRSFPIRNAMAGVIGALSSRIAYSMAREIPSRFAICVLGIPSAGKTSSRSSSPGWVGFRPARREFPLIGDNPPGPHRSHRQTESVTASESVENPDLMGVIPSGAKRSAGTYHYPSERPVRHGTG